MTFWLWLFKLKFGSLSSAHRLNQNLGCLLHTPKKITDDIYTRFKYLSKYQKVTGINFKTLRE